MRGVRHGATRHGVQARHRFRVLPALGFLAVLMALPSCGLPSPLAAATPCDYATQWRPPADNVALDDVAMVAPDEGWAVGATTNSQYQESDGLIYHLTGGVWQRLPQTYPNTPLASVSMDSPTDGWVMTRPDEGGVSGLTVALHYTGGQWRPVDIPTLDAVLQSGGILFDSVQMFGPDAGWMFAWGNGSSGASSTVSRGSVSTILRFEQGVWTPIAGPHLPDTSELFALSAVSADEAWIVGTDYTQQGQTTFFEHYTNGAWSRWPKTFSGVTERFTMLSPTDGWAFDGGDGSDTLLHYDGAHWAAVGLPGSWGGHNIRLGGEAFSIAPGVTWVVGSQENGWQSKSAIAQYSAGKWTTVPWPYTGARPLAMASGAPGEVWGVGDNLYQEGCPPGLTYEAEQGMFLHYQQGTWSQTVLP